MSGCSQPLVSYSSRRWCSFAHSHVVSKLIDGRNPAVRITRGHRERSTRHGSEVKGFLISCYLIRRRVYSIKQRAWVLSVHLGSHPSSLSGSLYPSSHYLARSLNPSAGPQHSCHNCWDRYLKCHQRCCGRQVQRIRGKHIATH